MGSGDEQATVGFAIPPALAAITARYELLAEVGRGGMGIVYKARDRQTADLVAVKVIHPSVAADSVLVERFRNELLLARRITHRNVCRVFDLNQFDGVAVISMEFVEGRSLRDMLREMESMSTRQGLKIVRQIAAGLGEAHAQGVVHRDLKPENILVARDGTVKIMDFGIARLADSRVTATGQLLGTPAYMSPEQAEGMPADARSDIYSLGLVMYEMFCGRPAFTAETPVAFVAKHARELPVPPRAIEADLPLRIDDAIRRCLEKNPAGRFQSVEDLDAALSAGAGVQADSAEHGATALPERLGGWQRADWGVLAAAAAGLILFFACFSSVSLAPRSQVAFDHSVLRRVADEYLQRLGVSGPEIRTIGTINAGAYVYLAKSYGAAAARDAANNPVRYWTWTLDFDHGSIDIDHRGGLVSFSREAVPLDANARPFDESRRQASRAAQDFFGHTMSTLELEHETRGRVDEFAWLGPSAARGLRQRYSVEIDARGISSLRRSTDVPPGYSMDAFPFGEITMNEWGLPLAVVIGACACLFGFVNRRRASQHARWRTAVTIAAFVVGGGYFLATFRTFGLGGAIAVTVAVGMLFAVVTYLGSIALEILSRRRDAFKLDTLNTLFSAAAGRPAPALSILRGCALGLLLVGVDTAAIWGATAHGGGRLSMIHIGLLGALINSSAWPLGLVAGISLIQVLGLSLLVALAHGVVSRVPMPAWAATLSAAALLGASGIRVSMATVEPWYLTALVLSIDYLVLLTVFRLFDLLTLSAAIGTFGFWWANYPLLVMQQPIGAVAPRIAFVMWGLLIAAAAVLAFESTLRRGYRRVAAAFE